jgi:hypothetical protein
MHMLSSTWLESLEQSVNVTSSHLEKYSCDARLICVQETRLLQTIDRLKQAATEENKTARISRTLKTLCKPKQWELANGKTVKVHTPLTTRAWELMQLYNGLRLPLTSIEERLDVLLHVKWTVKEFDCNLTREIVDLVCLHFMKYVSLPHFVPCKVPTGIGSEACTSGCL